MTSSCTNWIRLFYYFPSIILFTHTHIHVNIVSYLKPGTQVTFTITQLSYTGNLYVMKSYYTYTYILFRNKWTQNYYYCPYRICFELFYRNLLTVWKKKNNANIILLSRILSINHLNKFSLYCYDVRFRIVLNGQT